ncbi:TPA: septum formation inhibitor Maf [Campylobacter jejuni]|nr:septum formation inhibitor Maf [Campylobacter jejuni]HDZ5083546.1 septum formation inhibitor Maf [Campylobacter jejuni]HDZ5085290.1 septum formation inhibitor Maf [Campylobacter jejuni]HDZ5086685.1 septum formation inhibitor Maf [Campylobacter jejuni]HDZ5090114.1 septum formation inhibitor Maf [Campylobacter jejuni]
MLVLASSSISRANLLKEAKIDFRQVSFDYDENLDKNILPFLYVQKIVLEKERQFLGALAKDFQNQSLLFADSIVCVDEKILTKARDKKEAYEMLALQSGKHASILSAFLLVKPEKRVFSLSKTTLYFKNFDENALKDYIESGLYKGKAGCIMCEGFHQNFITQQVGNLSTALGLDIQTLKAYL